MDHADDTVETKTRLALFEAAWSDRMRLSQFKLPCADLHLLCRFLEPADCECEDRPVVKTERLDLVSHHGYLDLVLVPTLSDNQAYLELLRHAASHHPPSLTTTTFTLTFAEVAAAAGNFPLLRFLFKTAASCTQHFMARWYHHDPASQLRLFAHAITGGSKAVIAFLLDHLWEKLHGDVKLTVLELCLWMGDSEPHARDILKMVAHRIGINDKDRAGRLDPLRLACIYEDGPAADLFIDLGADMYAVNIDGHTIAYTAFKYSSQHFDSLKSTNSLFRKKEEGIMWQTFKTVTTRVGPQSSPLLPAGGGGEPGERDGDLAAGGAADAARDTHLPGRAADAALDTRVPGRPAGAARDTHLPGRAADAALDTRVPGRPAGAARDTHLPGRVADAALDTHHLPGRRGQRPQHPHHRHQDEDPRRHPQQAPDHAHQVQAQSTAGEHKVMEVLMRRGLSGNVMCVPRIKYHRPLIHTLLEHNLFALIELLVQGGGHGIDQRILPRWGAKWKFKPTLLRHAIDLSRYDIVDKLVELGADLNPKDGLPWTPLHEAIHKEYAAIIMLLVDRGARVDAVAPDGLTVLGHAVKNASRRQSDDGEIEVIKYLLQFNPPIQPVRFKVMDLSWVREVLREARRIKWSMLDIAVFNGDIELVSALLRALHFPGQVPAVTPIVSLAMWPPSPLQDKALTLVEDCAAANPLPSLLDLCRRRVRADAGAELRSRVQGMEVPATLRTFLLLEEELGPLPCHRHLAQTTPPPPPDPERAAKA